MMAAVRLIYHLLLFVRLRIRIGFYSATAYYYHPAQIEQCSDGGSYLQYWDYFDDFEYSILPAGANALGFQGTKKQA